MKSNDPNSVQYAECGAIFLELRDARRAARARFRDAWQSSGRDHADFRRALPGLLSEAFDSEGVPPAFPQERAPDEVRALDRLAQHQAATGHSVLRDGWRSAGFRSLSDFI